MKIYVLFYIYVFTTTGILSIREKRRIGAIFDKKSQHLLNTFLREVSRLDESDRNIQFEHYNKTVDCQDSFLVSNAICELLENNVSGILGAFQSCALSTIQSYTDTFKVPFISLGMPQQASSSEPYQLYIRPSYIKGLLDVMNDKEWTKIYYIYETDEGLVRLQQLFQEINEREMNLDIVVKRIESVEQCHQMLRAEYNIQLKEDFRIFLDLTLQQSQDLISVIKNDTDINNNRFHFLLGDLGIKDMNKYVLSAGMNISGFTLKKEHDANTYFSASQYPTFGDVLVRDAVLVFHRALKKVGNIHEDTDTPIKCRDNKGSVHTRPGKHVLNELKKGEYNGLSGLIKFDVQGWRKEFEIPLHETRMNMRIAKIGTYKPGELRLHEPEIQQEPTMNTTSKKVVRRIVTVKEAPYVMYIDDTLENNKESKAKAPKCGIEHFHGYIIDLIKKVADYLKFEYELCLSYDGQYGKKLSNGTWNGVIAELTRGTADIAFSAMTISSERERVVDFTKPFMSLGISIMIKKPNGKKAHTFSFMDPLSYEIWMCILFAYVGVSVVLFLVSRFSPTEWHVEDDKTIKNDFTISNSLWYSLGAFMQQGCDISPKSVSGRIVGSVWWFFTLIIISSYTANLAAFLTVERMNTPIESAEDLAKQTQIQYGVYGSGTTRDFFRLSKVAVYERMWAYMTSAQDVFVGSTEEGVNKVRTSNGKYAYLIESSTNEYINSRKPCDTMKVGSNLDSKGYGIATPIGSDLRDQLTLAVLHLREKGDLQALKKKWWDDRSECDDQTSAMDGSEAELKLNNVAGIFYILIGGLSLSVIIAGLEFLYRSIVDSRKSKQALGTIVRNKARLSFRGSMDSGNPESTTPLKKSCSSGTYTYTGPPQLPGFDPYVDTNTHTQV